MVGSIIQTYRSLPMFRCKTDHLVKESNLIIHVYAMEAKNNANLATCNISRFQKASIWLPVRLDCIS